MQGLIPYAGTEKASRDHVSFMRWVNGRLFMFLKLKMSFDLLMSVVYIKTSYDLTEKKYQTRLFHT